MRTKTKSASTTLSEKAQIVLSTANWTGHSLAELASFGRIGDAHKSAHDWINEVCPLQSHAPEACIAHMQLKKEVEDEVQRIIDAN